MNEKKLTLALEQALTRITRETGLVGGVVDVIQALEVEATSNRVS